MNKMNTKSGFTLIEIMIVVAIIIILATLAVPAFNQARLKGQRAVCVNNLRLIDGGKDQYALENAGVFPTLAELVSGEILKRTPVCPAAGAYTPGGAGTDAACSKAAAPELHVLVQP